MRKISNSNPTVAVFAILLVSFAATPAGAAPIELIFAGEGSGSVDGAAFTDAALSIRLLGDTTDVGPAPSPVDVVSLEGLIGTVDIDGFASATTINPQSVFVNRTNESAGILDATLRADWLAVTVAGAGLDSYGLDGDIGPIDDSSPFIDPGLPVPLRVPLSIGELELTAVSNLSFSALVVPAPAAAWLFISGAAAGLRWMGRTQKKPA